ncbi:flagellar hook-length control protein FliK [Aliiglaciecola sp. 3_MG-2023]|uniref:flagellar hook-length control protein FliK n=1 Tax=Aliiglaciecola sp. 3_MG-2023 TaxID=3062644 RepID=UPI0026E2BF6F|nr:flagellar hook-length control protein FliK [Aliiglaciecola sp. 3_MG-2023]MDO6692713.1 flagellar hook-length control protein FliK [Aliiglaciecola sp. 3_MG-2023]
MSDISLNAQQQLVQVAAQLSKLSTNSPVAKQAAQVIVQFLANNQIGLTLPKQQQTVTLPKPANLPQALNATQVQAQLQNHTSSSGNQNTTSELLLFSTSTKTDSQSVLASLNQKQLSTILNAISSKASPSGQAKSANVEVKVVSSHNNTLNLSTQIQGKSELIKVTLPTIKQVLPSNQNLHLQITPKGNQWQVKLNTESQTKLSTVVNTDSQTSHQNQQTVRPNYSQNNQQHRGVPPNQQNLNNSQTQANAQTTTQSQTNPGQKVIMLNLSKPDIVKLLQSDSAKLHNTAHNVSLSVPRQTLIETLTKHPELRLDNAVSKLLQVEGSVKNVSINILVSGLGEIKAPVKTPLAQLPLTEAQVKQIKQVLFLQTDPKPTSNQTAEPSVLRSDTAIVKPETSSKSQAIGQSAQMDKPHGGHNTNQLPAKEATPNPVQTDRPEVVKTLPNLTSKIAAIPAAEKQQILSQISELMRRVLPQVASPSDTLQKIEIALGDPILTKSPETKAVVESILKQLQQGTPQGKEADVENIKQLITQAPLNLTPIQLTQAISSQGLVAGLMTMLQVSLAAKLNRNQPQNSEKIAQIVSGLLSGSNKTVSPPTQRSLSDLNQMEQKHQILKQLGRMFAQHQSSKMNNAEQALQGQESFYYVLPSGIGENKKDIELLIKREPDKHGNADKQKSKLAIWHLTMKMDIGDIGQILTKAKLQQNELELDLYTSNEAVKDLVYNYLPMFKKRLKSLGIEVAKAQCQLGKIPEHLQTRPYHIFQTQA